jgi:prephenate dehydratase
MRLGYLGPPGTYTEEAASRYRSDAELIPYATEGQAATAVEEGVVDEAMLAIENSLEGTVTPTMDALIHDTRLSIKAEVVLPIEHCLIVRPGTTLDEIESVHAHPQALAQCRKFIERQLPHARQDAALSNAAAVEEVLRMDRAAAIASHRAAELHGGLVLRQGIADNPHNKTRFVALATDDHEPTGRDKTSIAFSVAHDKPGSLVDVLHEFSDRAINLTKIESRPSREELGIYIFLIDLAGHRDDPVVDEALKAVQGKAIFFRILGSYPQGEAPDA